jgi:hypothetical protein
MSDSLRSGFFTLRRERERRFAALMGVLAEAQRRKEVRCAHGVARGGAKTQRERANVIKPHSVCHPEERRVSFFSLGLYHAEKREGKEIRCAHGGSRRGAKTQRGSLRSRGCTQRRGR